MRAKDAKGTMVQLDYTIHIQEIKPWPPSQSLKMLRAVLIQWEYGARKSGSTSQVVPLVEAGSSVGGGRIEFNESFRLSVTLAREKSMKARNGEHFVKNCIEFNLYEPRRDQTTKGQLLGTAVLDFSDYGVINGNLIIPLPINCKRTYGNTVQPLLFLNLQRNTSHTNSLSNSVLREPSNKCKHGVTAPDMMVEEECRDEGEAASFTTDDDVSSHSSLVISSSGAGSNGCSSPQNKNDEGVISNCVDGGVPNVSEPDKHDTKTDEVQTIDSGVLPRVSPSKSSSIDVSSDIAWISKRITSQTKHSFVREEVREQDESCTTATEYPSESQSTQHKVEKVHHTKEVNLSVSSPFFRESTLEESVPFTDVNDLLVGGIKPLAGIDDIGGKHVAHAEGIILGGEEQRPGAVVSFGVIVPFTDGNDLLGGGIKASTSVDDIGGKHATHAEGIISEQGEQGVSAVVSGDIPQVDEQLLPKLEINLDSSNVFKSKNGKSVRSSLDSSRSRASTQSKCIASPDTVQSSISSNLRDSKSCNDDKDTRIRHLERRMRLLEAELREAAAVEASIYSVVAEHGYSINKVHTPARRLWRLYSHISNQYTESSRASAARSVVTGLVLVAKACGSDVPRLTFWLSNSIVLRVIVSMSMVDNQLPNIFRSDIQKGALNEKKQSSALKWESLTRKGARGRVADLYCDWANPSTFAAALERVEGWIFSRITESLWWQTFTPHMQSGAARCIFRSRDSGYSTTGGENKDSTEQKQTNCSVELWKKAFRDTRERICPVRAEGHDCGCFPGLLKLIMEQLVSRLDVAMFNAILRESSFETPTDPVADPISDAEVLPIPTGKASFGAGAQLKNAIGSWSRLLTDLFDIDDGDFPKNDSSELGDDDDDERMSSNDFSKSFHLLNALSDLMMLPKDMLLSQTIRREVCPAFGPPLITRILSSFVPDEFCADPIPRVVFEALNLEDPSDAEGDSIIGIPCAAAPIVYQAPSSASVSTFIQKGKHPELSRSRSSLLRKSQTSDDELDELNAPLGALIAGSDKVCPSKKLPWDSNTTGRRHRLLREVWMNSP